jgi:hypothetical protein
VSGLPLAVSNDSSVKHDINFIGQSPHVFAYRIFIKRPQDDDFVEFAVGDTDDDIPDHFATDPLPDATRVIMNVAVGGARNSAFRYVVTFSQNGAVVLGGTLLRNGRTRANGGGGDQISLILV